VEVTVEFRDLSSDEKVFFAGSLRTMILADGIVEDDEIAWVDKIRDEDRFEDMDACLDEFDERIDAIAIPADPLAPLKRFFKLAESITRGEAQALILSRLESISLRDGYQKKAESDFFVTLRETWGLQADR
jgi:hypothetical protein